jgi:iron complex outermembrane receptor protein
MKSIAGSTKRFIFIFLQFVALTSLASGAYALDLDQTVDFNIPKQKLDSALVQFSGQARIQITSSSDQVKDFSTDGIVGRYKVSIALKTLLKRSGLSYKPIGQSAISIGKFPAGSERSTTQNASSGSSDDATSNMEGKENSSQDFRVAQVDQTPVGPAAVEQKEEDQQKKVGLEEIVVTGTHIAGASPVGSSLITVTAEDIANSGYSNVGDVIRSLPQASGGGVNPGVVGASGSNNANNVSSASTVNLRGLGSSSTLTLIDGHRLAFDGGDGSVDISVIPIAAIERVELLTDSASSIYGSDAVAGVANFILKKDYEGAQTALRYGDSTRGGAQEREASQLLGVNWSKGSAMVSFEHDDQQPVLAADRDVSSLAPSPLTLLPDTKRNSVFASAHQGVSDDATAYVEGLYSDRTTDLILNYGVPSFNHVGVTIFGVSPGFGVLAAAVREVPACRGVA